MSYPTEQPKWQARSRVAERPAAHLPIGPALLTSVLVARSTALCAELREVINESREAVWRSSQVGLSAYPRIRAIAGASDANAGLIIAVITDAPMCGECIARKSGMPKERLERVLATIAETIKVTHSMGPCAACLSIDMVFSLANGGATRGTTRREILRFLEQHRDAAFCASCVASQLYGGRDIDVAMRHLEGHGVHRHYGRCSACGLIRLVASAPSSN